MSLGATFILLGLLNFSLEVNFYYIFATLLLWCGASTLEPWY